MLQKQLKGLLIPLLILQELIIRIDIFLYLIPQSEILDKILVREALFYLALLRYLLGLLFQLIARFTLAVTLKLVVVLIRKMLKFKLLLEVFSKQMRNYLWIEILLAVKLVDLLFLPVKNTYKDVQLAQAWELHRLLQKLVFPFRYCRSSNKLALYWA